MVGGGIFAVLGTAVGLAGGGTPVAFAVAGLVALATSYSYAKLSVRFPSSGGTIVFVDRAFGIDFVTGALNLLLWLSYLVTIALYASAFGAYGLTFFTARPAGLRHLLVSIAIVVPALLNVLDADVVSESETAIVVLKLLQLGLVIGAGLPHVDPSRLALDTWAPPVALVAGGMVIFVAYEGFELISNAAADVRRPATTLPRAFYGCVVFVILLYVSVAIVTVGSVPPEVVAKAQDYALSEAARPSLGRAGFVIVAVSALLATFSAINATVYGNARLGFTLAKDGELPDIFERRTWSRPLAGVALTAGLSLLLANLVDLEAIAILGSAGFLLIFCVVNAAAFRLAASIDARRSICALATLACLAAFGTLVVHTFESSPKALLVFGGFVALSAGFESIYPRISGRDFASLRGSAPTDDDASAPPDPRQESA